jgi:aspartyl/asparaginyl beta-hydroxylase (cupin superfamily)
MAGEKHPLRMIFSHPTHTAFEDTAMLGACPYFREVLDAFACEVFSVRLMRLTPGSVIKEHSDGLLAAEEERARLHIPVLTNRDAIFEVNQRAVEMTAGSLWYLRLSDPHRAVNRGDTDRVHMVVDVGVNDWLRGLLAASVASAAAP